MNDNNKLLTSRIGENVGKISYIVHDVQRLSVQMIAKAININANTA